MKSIAILIVAIIVAFSGCHAPAAVPSPSPTSSVFSSMPSPILFPAPTPYNTYETIGTVDGPICGLILGMPMEEAEALLEEPRWTRDEYAFGFVDYEGVRLSITITEQGYAGPRGIQIGDDMYDTIQKFYVTQEPFLVSTGFEYGSYCFKFPLYEADSLYGEFSDYTLCKCYYCTSDAWIHIKFEDKNNTIRRISAGPLSSPGRIPGATPTPSGSGIIEKDPHGIHDWQFTQDIEQEDAIKFRKFFTENSRFPAANTGEARFGELEGDFDLLGLTINTMTSDELHQVLGDPPYIWRECEFGAVRYKKNNSGKYILYEIDIDSYRRVYDFDYDGKFVLGIEKGMDPFEAIERMFVQEDGSRILYYGYYFDRLPQEGWESVQSEPQSGLTLFYYGFESPQEDSVFSEDRFCMSGDIMQAEHRYSYWVFLGLADYIPDDSWVIRQVIRYLGE